MNDFLKHSLEKKDNLVWEEAGIPLEPFQVYCIDYKFWFVLGCIAKYDIVFNELSDGCRYMGSLQHIYKIDGKVYDFTRLSSDDAYRKWLEVIAEMNAKSNPAAVSVDDIVF